ncbi:glycosyltransferase family 4 protein [Desulfobotulus sp. H1]|uniref:Glycosyltransferase family 4 protein n=1 Tax=Desulfobotulus pelophilus TaxID=2823377 RepID=A0ABT3NCX9_9BACT|nr:glycosyltransferase family 4 protein [Desulfobotulus pelophilus]MCW7755322.1 glycosyltransferase family 4 protein [Desulfobotulus pelophilus]
MRVAIIGSTAETLLGFRSGLIRDLVSQGYEVYAFASDFHDIAVMNKISLLGAVPVPYTLSRSGLNPLKDLFNTVKLASLLRKKRIDIVFSYFAKPVVFGILAAVMAGVKRRIGMLEGLGYVFTDRPEGLSVRRRFLKFVQVFLYRIAFLFAEKIIFLNQDDFNDLITVYGIKVKQICILGGIGLDLFSYPYTPPSQNPVSFIFVGRMLAEKGVHEYVAAAKIVKAVYPKAHFVMLGGLDKNNPGGITESRLKDLMASGTIEYPGHVSNVVEWVARSSVFVLPSYREGLPRSTQEAMAIGRAVITTDVPGCRETVTQGVNGFMVPPWSPDELAEKMIYFIENPEEILRMGLESYQIAREKFDEKKVNHKLISLIKEP